MVTQPILCLVGTSKMKGVQHMIVYMVSIKIISLKYSILVLNLLSQTEKLMMISWAIIWPTISIVYQMNDSVNKQIAIASIILLNKKKPGTNIVFLPLLRLSSSQKAPNFFMYRASPRLLKFFTNCQMKKMGRMSERVNKMAHMMDMNSSPGLSMLNIARLTIRHTLMIIQLSFMSVISYTQQTF